MGGGGKVGECTCQHNLVHTVVNINNNNNFWCLSRKSSEHLQRYKDTLISSHTHTHTHTHTETCTHTDAYTHTHTDAHARTPTDTHTDTHTHYKHMHYW